MPSISLCMIVRDEEAVLDTCLESITGLVDEICVLDTGSTDRTVEIALARGARVEHFEWCDDFSAARNAVLAMATCDWILVLDADERLDDESAKQKLHAFAKAHPRSPGHVTIVNEFAESESRGAVTRFFPRSLQPNFKGRVHEQLHLGETYPKRYPTGIDVRHIGYRPEVLKGRDKLARNERYLAIELKENPEDAYLWFQLGRNHLHAENHSAALDALSKALDHVESDAAYLASLFELTGQCLASVGQPAQALSLLQQVSGAFLDRSDMVYLEAQLALECGLLEEAELGFQRCLKLAEKQIDQDVFDGQGPSSSVATTWGPSYHMGVLREVLGMLDDAREFYERALGHQPDHQDSLDALARLEANAAGTAATTGA